MARAATCCIARHEWKESRVPRSAAGASRREDALQHGADDLAGKAGQQLLELTNAEPDSGTPAALATVDSLPRRRAAAHWLVGWWVPNDVRLELEETRDGSP